jgi:hypothetical protein
MAPYPVHTFRYHACAHAFSARFTRPFDELIDVQAPSSLPTTGGHGNSRVENFRFREFVSFKSGYTHVSGAHQADDGSNNTLVTSTVEGLNLMDVVTADRLVTRLYSKHLLNATEGSITLVGSKVENLRIAGYPVHVELDLDLFEKIPTYAVAQNEFAKKGDFFKIADDPFRTGQSIPTRDANGAFLCSCIKELDTKCPGVKRSGHCFAVPGFGKIYLGEVILRHGERSLTMIRFELGSAVSGTGSAGGGTSNGHHFP